MSAMTAYARTGIVSGGLFCGMMTVTAILLVLSGSNANASGRHLRHHPGYWPGYGWRSPPPPPFGAHFGPDGVLYSAMGSAIPGYVISQPNRCWIEGSYGQWKSCN